MAKQNPDNFGMEWKNLIEDLCAKGWSQLDIAIAIGKSQAWVSAVLNGQYVDLKWSDGEALRKLHAGIVSAKKPRIRKAA